MKIRLNIDTQELTNKPKRFDPQLRNRLCSAASIREITPDQLIEAVRHGRSFTPAVMTGTTGDTWQSQQVICADIDNDTGRKDTDGHKIPIAPPLSADQARDIMARHGIDPYFMYWSFSNTETWPKFRIVLILDAPLEDPEEAEDLISRFTGIFNRAVPHSADTTARDRARLYYGGRVGCILYEGRKTTPTALLSALPEYDPAGERTEKPAEAAGFGKANQNTAEAGSGTQRRLNALLSQLEVDKNTFNLSAYIQSTEPISKPVKCGRALFFNPCPICRHNDCFQVTDNIYHCHSASDNTSGSIVDYLMHRHRLTKGEALDRFKYEIMGYSREEWRAAYKTDKEGARTAARDGNQPAGRDSPFIGDIRKAKSGERAAELAQNRQNDHKGINTRIEVEKPTESRREAVAGKSEVEKAMNLSAADGVACYIDTLMSEEIEQFRHEISTGFKSLDEQAGGGLYPGLYIVAAISSLGKTTFCHQIADQMASSGTDVLFFTLEQSRLEMVSKSLARRNAQRTTVKSRLTSLAIRKGYRPAGFTDAVEDYKKAVGNRLSIIERNFDCDIDFIRDYVQEYIQANRGRLTTTNSSGRSVTKKPVVIIDYLQILKPKKDTAGRAQPLKDAMDEAVTTLKRLSRELNITIIAISSVNRANYLTPIDLESIKESGGIEYTADVVLGLQLQCLNEDGFTNYDIKKKRQKVQDAKRAKPREIQLVCLKNRFGTANFVCNFEYYPDIDLFKEADTAAPEDEEIERRAVKPQKRAKTLR